jgi:hypothetical protein
MTRLAGLPGWKFPSFRSHVANQTGDSEGGRGFQGSTASLFPYISNEHIELVEG